MSPNNKKSPVFAIGIDLGTTFSGAAIYRRQQCEMIPNKDGNYLTPSCVFYHPDSLEISVGRSAEILGVQKIDNFLYDIKRIIGRKYNDAYVDKIKESKHYAYKIVKGDDDMAEIEITHDGLTVCKTPQAICSEILRYLKESASEYLGAEITEATISIPAHFSIAQRKATWEAAELAGLKVLKLISEPVAAAIYYAEDRLEHESTMLVFDLGGGTLDISIIKVEEKSFTVKSVEGDTFLGGRDFDQILLSHFRTAITNKFGFRVLNERLLHRVNKSCTTLKEMLSNRQRSSIPLDYIGGNEESTFNLSMTRVEFEHLIDNEIARAKDLVTKCLKEADLIEDNISDVVLVGGSTRIPKVKKMLENYYGAEKMRTDLNPDEAVALGVGIQAALVKKENRILEKYEVSEITPLSLGQCVGRNLMLVHIKKNSRLPIRSMPIKTITSKNNQRCCTMQIFEGERKNCKYNNLLGSFTIDDLPPGRAGDIEFETIFALNEDGILEVESYELSTGKRNKLVVTIGAFGLCDYKVRHSIEEAERNREEDDVFETFENFYCKIKTIGYHIIYDLNKIQHYNDRRFVKEITEKFLDDIKEFEYTEKEKLEHKCLLLKNSVSTIIDNVIHIDWPYEVTVLGLTDRLRRLENVHSLKKIRINLNC